MESRDTLLGLGILAAFIQADDIMDKAQSGEKITAFDALGLAASAAMVIGNLLGQRKEGQGRFPGP